MTTTLATNRWMSELDFAMTQLAILLVILLLAVDSINPVKLFLHVFAPYHIAPWHIASLCLALMLYVFLNNMKELLYFGVKVFFHSILSIFFNRVEAIGLDNVPQYGPVIFTSNHANQFIDGVTIMCTCRRKISYLVAEKSWNRRIIGDIAWAMGAVPVKRAQDSAKKGTGKVVLRRKKKDKPESVAGEGEGAEKKEKEDNAKVSDEAQAGAEAQPDLIEVTGTDTKFSSELGKGDKIRLPGTAAALKVVDIPSDVLVYVESNPDFPENFLATPDAQSSSPDPAPYDVLKRVDQKVVYEKVLDELASGGTIGIFPEGGSHDRTDLLPLKVGVALIAYSALEKDGTAIPIVPVGLNYFRAHRFRGRSVVEFGRPTYVDPETLDDYKAGGLAKRKVVNELLEGIEDSMRSVIVSAPDYDALMLVQTARRLYQRKEGSASEKQDMTRRFAEGYRRLIERSGGDLPPKYAEMQKRLVAYASELRDLGIRDYQVAELREHLGTNEITADKAMDDNRVLYHIAHLIVVLALAAVPAACLNLPVGLLARLYSDRRRRKALAASKVKIKGRDVVLSEKVLFCIVAVPTMWIVWGLALAFLTDLDRTAVVLAVSSMPAFSYIGIVTAEMGMADWKKDLRPYLMRLFPSARRRMAALPGVRRELQRDLRAFVAEIGPTMGDLYWEKEVDWKSINEDTRKKSAVDKVASEAETEAVGKEGKKDQ